MAHVAAEVAPSAADAVPAEQGVQLAKEVAPAVGEKEPAGQVVQEAARAAENFPGGQGAQDAAPAPAKLPAAHGTHVEALLAPVTALAVPASQAWHADAVVLLREGL